jgi:hypothetical protein
LKVLNVRRTPAIAQRLGAGRLVELGEIDDWACTGESVSDDRLALLAQFEGNDEW